MEDREIFAVGSDSNVWQIWQTAPNGDWGGWRSLGRPPVGIGSTDRISVESNKDLRQELFVMGQDGAVWHVWQERANGGWSEWASLDRATERELSQPLVKKNADGHLEVFAPGNGVFCNRWQEAPNSNVWRHEGWNEKPIPTPSIRPWLEVALNRGGLRSGHLEVFGFGEDGALWHAWQIDVAPFWSAWDSLGNPPGVGLHVGNIPDGTSSRLGLAVGANQNGSLQVFAIGGDDAVWHRAQMR